MCFDKADYYCEKAREAYCQTAAKGESSLTEDDEYEITRRAGNHIGFFLTWIVRRGFAGEMH